MNQKLKKKLILIIILGIIFVLTVFNLHKIKFALSMLNLYNQEKNIESVTDNPEDIKPSIVDNPLQSIIESEDIVGNMDNHQVPVDNSKDDPDKPITVVPKPVIPTPNPIEITNKSYIDIVKEYNDKLENLRSTFEIELNELVAKGIEEYSNGVISSTKLANKLLSAGSKLEKTSDNEFDIIVKDMEKELKANNQDTAVIKEIRNYYSSFKNSKKQDMISKGMKYVK